MPEKQFESDFSIVQTTYAVAMVLGLEKIAESVYLTFVERSYAESDYVGFMIIKGILAAALALLGIRFMSAPRNIRRLVLAHANDAKDQWSKILKRVTTVHLPVLLIHALLFYILCHMALKIESLSEAWQVMPKLTWLYAALLTINAVWLTILIKGREKPFPENVWISLNLIFAALLVTTLLAYQFFMIPQWAFFAASTFFMFSNSFLDLSKTAESYLSKKLPGGAEN